MLIYKRLIGRKPPPHAAGVVAGAEVVEAGLAVAFLAGEFVVVRRGLRVNVIRLGGEWKGDARIASATGRQLNCRRMPRTVRAQRQSPQLRQSSLPREQNPAPSDLARICN